MGVLAVYMTGGGVLMELHIGNSKIHEPEFLRPKKYLASKFQPRKYKC